MTSGGSNPFTSKKNRYPPTPSAPAWHALRGEQHRQLGNGYCTRPPELDVSPALALHRHASSNPHSSGADDRKIFDRRMPNECGRSVRLSVALTRYGNIDTVDLFDIIAGSIGIISAAFGFYTYYRGKTKELVETQKAQDLNRQLADILSVSGAAAQQGALAANLSDRDEVTKKELKHLMLSQMATLEALANTVRRTEQLSHDWKFGIPTRYVFESDAKKVEDTKP